MFHFRWAHEADAKKAGDVLPRQWRTDLPEEAMVEAARNFRDHQVRRLWVVGSNETTGPLIEESYRIFLRLFDTHLQAHPFLMGGRPGASDFAVFGQLTQLALFDPTPVAITLEISPRAHAWVERSEDLSGIDALDDQWLRGDALPTTLKALLSEVGRVYAPVMLANLEALERGEARMQTHIDGRTWEQPAFPYQGKCLRWLRQERASLTDEARATVDRALEGSGCEALF